MGVAFTVGYRLNQKDLPFNALGPSNVPFDPWSIKYNIFDSSGGNLLLIAPMDRDPVRLGVGAYYADFAIPENANFGEHLIQWQVQDTNTSPARVIEERFTVVGLDVKTTEPNLPDFLRDLVLKLRIMLRDNNPDRNYHFRPPTNRDAIRGYTEKFGYIWETDELISFLDLAAQYISVMPPRTDIMLDNIPYGWEGLILQQAAVYAIQAVTLNWIEEEFGYSIQGISLDIDKAAKYESMANTLADRLDAALEKAKSGIKVIKGLQQNKFRVGAQGVLGPYTGRGSTNPRNWVGDSLGRPQY